MKSQDCLDLVCSEGHSWGESHTYLLGLYPWSHLQGFLACVQSAGATWWAFPGCRGDMQDLAVIKSFDSHVLGIQAVFSSVLGSGMFAGNPKCLKLLSFLVLASELSSIFSKPLLRPLAQGYSSYFLLAQASAFLMAGENRVLS